MKPHSKFEIDDITNSPGDVEIDDAAHAPNIMKMFIT